MGEENPPVDETQPLDETLSVEINTAAPEPVVIAPVLKLITFDQILIDGKLGGPPAPLMAKRPELIPHIVELFKAREAKLQENHAAQLRSLSPSA